MAVNLELWRAVPQGAHEILPDRKCPACGSTRTHRSRVRGAVEGVLKTVTPLRPFTCSECHWRGWKIPVASNGPAVALPPLPEKLRSREHRHAARRDKPDARRRRKRLQIGMTIVLAVVMGAAVVRCQGADGDSAAADR